MKRGTEKLQKSYMRQKDERVGNEGGHEPRDPVTEAGMARIQGESLGICRVEAPKKDESNVEIRKIGSSGQSVHSNKKSQEGNAPHSWMRSPIPFFLKAKLAQAIMHLKGRSVVSFGL